MIKIDENTLEIINSSEKLCESYFKEIEEIEFYYLEDILFDYLYDDIDNEELVVNALSKKWTDC